MICWEPYAVRFADIIDGVRDDYLISYFTAAKQYPGRVILRLFHESNGNWYPWSPTGPERLVSDTRQWQDAWRHIIALSRKSGATNVKFMFCPNSTDVDAPPAEALWPGAEWVDIIGLDGYNDGRCRGCKTA